MQAGETAIGKCKLEVSRTITEIVELISTLPPEDLVEVERRIADALSETKARIRRVAVKKENGNGCVDGKD